VKVHVKAILRKARLRNRTQVAMWASRQGFPFLEAAQHL
jgi:DNA-binding NarL/FixJ family response regulator